MNILVTGSSGFAGRHLTKYLQVKGHTALIPEIDLLNATETEVVISKQKFDAVVHLAAMAEVGTSMISPAKILRNNIFAQLNLLEALRRRNSKARVLIICSADEYGGSQEGSIDENAQFMPASPYAVSKIAQDFLGLQYFLSYGLNIIRLRPFNHIGEGQRIGFVVPDFVKQIVEIEKSGQSGEIIVGNLEAVRDFTDVLDMVSAYELALIKGQAGEVYNVGSGKGVKISYLLNQLVKMSKAKIKITVDESRFRPGEPSQLICNSEKFMKATGWKPEIPLEKTLERVLEWWRKTR
ncbi:GDP-mannose 4,6-dehydratase [Candidatus Collierbacteria bacterium]|nr:GDP-mannose 4,6-dehydratase [Candidatus Collierbacteria bacterium]